MVQSMARSPRPFLRLAGDAAKVQEFPEDVPSVQWPGPAPPGRKKFFHLVFCCANLQSLLTLTTHRENLPKEAEPESGVRGCRLETN